MYHLGVGGYFALTNRKSYKEFHKNIKGGYYMDKLAIEFEEEFEDGQTIATICNITELSNHYK